MCRHYSTNSGCGKCLDTVFTSRQKPSKHMKKCKALPKDVAKEKPPTSNVKGTSPSSSKKKKKRHQKKKKSHGDSQPSSQKDLQCDSQPDLQKDAQESPCQSIHQVCKEPTTASPQKKHSRGATKHSSKNI